MRLSELDRSILDAAALCGREHSDGFAKCDQVLRHLLITTGALTPDSETALCCSGFEHREVGQLYNQLRALVRRGLLLAHGDLKLPAGPRYTECAVSEGGRELLASPPATAT